jgi:multimeric flavodoxin WrbA
MKKVTAFIGSARKKATYQAVQELEKDLKKYGEIDFETVFLSDYNLGFCQGCLQCFDKGEKNCPLKDDRDILLEKLEHSDGVIFATPSYAFQVSARMKNFLDRMAFIYHRPRFFRKTFTGVVTMGIPMGGNRIRKYLESTGVNLGFDIVKGSCVWTLQPMTEQQIQKMKQEMKLLSDRFYKNLVRSSKPSPSLFRLMMFRMSRTGFQKAGLKNQGSQFYDYSYYQEKGWFQSDYYFETRLGPVKKAAGFLFDFLGSRLF